MDRRFSARRTALEERMTDAGVDGVVLSSGPNCQYFTGFRGEEDRFLLVYLQADQDPIAVSPDQYVGQVQDNAEVGEVHAVGSNSAGAVTDGICQILSTPDRLVIDDTARADVTTHLIRETSVDVGLASDLIGPLRLQKDPEELAKLGEAASIADTVSAEIRTLGSDAIGMTERELAIEIRSRLHAEGGERLSFPVSVGAGPNGARPTTYRHGDRTIQRGDPVVLDFGAFIDGYASDQTRTCVFAGTPPEGFTEAYEAAKSGLDAGVDAVTPGTTAADVDQAVREAIDEYGLVDHFTHGTGHGVGLDAHEPPAITEDNQLTLDEGMVFSIEPGIYFAEEFGVRVEDLVTVTEEGSRRLNASPYTWRPLDD